MGSQRAPRVRRKKRDEELEPELVPSQAAMPRAPAIPALELQKTAGNRAVGAALGRWPMWFSKPHAQWPKEPQVIVDGTAIPMVSFSWGESTGHGAGGGNTITLKDVLLTSFSAAGDVDTFTANFAKYEMGTSPPGP